MAACILQPGEVLKRMVVDQEPTNGSSNKRSKTSLSLDEETPTCSYTELTNAPQGSSANKRINVNLSELNVHPPESRLDNIRKTPTNKFTTINVPASRSMNSRRCIEDQEVTPSRSSNTSPR